MLSLSHLSQPIKFFCLVFLAYLMLCFFLFWSCLCQLLLIFSFCCWSSGWSLVPANLFLDRYHSIFCEGVGHVRIGKFVLELLCLQLSVVCYLMSFGHSSWSRFLVLEKMLLGAFVSVLEKVLKSSRCQRYSKGLKSSFS